MNKIFDNDPIEIKNILEQTCFVNIPTEINTPEDMLYASQLLAKINANRCYVMSITLEAEFMTKSAKQAYDLLKDQYESLPKAKRLEGTSLKEEVTKRKIHYEDVADKKKACVYMQTMLDNQYTTLSRLVTIKIEANKEITRIQ